MNYMGIYCEQKEFKCRGSGFYAYNTCNATRYIIYDVPFDVNYNFDVARVKQIITIIKTSENEIIEKEFTAYIDKGGEKGFSSIKKDKVIREKSFKYDFLRNGDDYDLYMKKVKKNKQDIFVKKIVQDNVLLSNLYYNYKSLTC